METASQQEEEVFDADWEAEDEAAVPSPANATSSKAEREDLSNTARTNDVQMQQPEATTAEEDNAEALQCMDAADGMQSPSQVRYRPLSASDFQAVLRERIRKVVAQKAGPSFEERAAASAARRRQEAKKEESEQKEKLKEIVLRAKSRPSESPTRTRTDAPEPIESRVKLRLRAGRETARAYAQQVADIQHRMATREPLFRVEAVQSATQELRHQQELRRKQLREEEREQWRHLKGLKESVLQRPLLLEQEKNRDWVEQRSAEALQRGIITETAQGPLDLKIQRALVSFQSSDWGKQVESLKEKLESRPKLHEIHLTPRKREAEEYRKSPILLKIEAELMEKVALRSQQQKREEQRQWQALRQCVERGGMKSPLLGSHKVSLEGRRRLSEVAAKKREDLEAVQREQWAKIRMLKARGAARSQSATSLSRPSTAP